jgi:hypothetical protein
MTVNVKEPLNRPGVFQRVPGHPAREGGEAFSLTHRPPLPHEMLMVLIFIRDWVDPRAMVRSEGICH